MYGGGEIGRTPGGGRIQVLKETKKEWKKLVTIPLPKAVKFKDYSSLCLREDYLTIISQEDSKLWIGKLHPRKWAIQDNGVTYTFPRKKSGALKYCNVEGACWIGKKHILVVSDKAKKAQPPTCKNKEQSIHIFEIPD